MPLHLQQVTSTNMFRSLCLYLTRSHGHQLPNCAQYQHQPQPPLSPSKIKQREARGGGGGCERRERKKNELYKIYAIEELVPTDTISKKI